MMFAWPHLLWLLLAPAAGLAWELAHRRGAAAASHPHILRAEAGAHSLELSPAPVSAAPLGKRTRPRFWLALGLALTVVALARPQWGRIEEPVFDQSREILLALDVSRSMLTPDVNPSRLDRAKLLIQSLLDRLTGERVGLEIFSGTAFLQAPLSSDYEILREFLPSLSPDYMPEGGTNYGALIDAAAGAFTTGPGADRFLIILSDGGATDEDWRSHVKRLTDRGIRVIGLGVGTRAGGLIPDGTGGYVKDDNGAVVMAKLESDTLQELATKTGGAYRDASEWVDLAALLKTTVEAGRKGKFVEKNAVRYVERFQWALAPALLCLLLSFWKDFPVRPKPREIRLAARGGKGVPSAAALALFLAVFGLLPSAGAAAGAVPPPLPPSALLGKIVGRLSGQEVSTAPDWAELAQETVSWGQDLQTHHQPVTPGPVHDGLAAVDAGDALDAKAANWEQLRSQLEALLKQSEDEKKQQQQQQQQQKDQQQQNQQQQDKQQQDQQKSSQSQQNSGNPQQNQNPPPQPQNSSPSEQQNSGNPPPQKGSNPQSQSAFGNLQPPGQPPPSGTQQVGGEPKQKTPDPAQADPALAMSLQKLDQIHNQDSPAQLFQMIENNEPHPAPDKKGKNW